MSRILKTRQSSAPVLGMKGSRLGLLGIVAMLLFRLPAPGAHPETTANREVSMEISRTESGAAVISYSELRTHLLPRATRKLLNRAIKLDKKGSTGEALVLVEKALESAPDFVEAHTAAAIANLKLERLGEAQRHLDQALKIDGTLLPAREVQGILLFHEQRYAEARAVLQAVVKRVPSRAVAHQYLAATLRALNEVGLAQQHESVARELRAKPIRTRREPRAFIQDSDRAGWSW